MATVRARRSQAQTTEHLPTIGSAQAGLVPRSASAPIMPALGVQRPHGSVSRLVVRHMSTASPRRPAQSSGGRTETRPRAETAVLACAVVGVSILLYAWPRGGQMHLVLLNGWLACFATGLGALPVHWLFNSSTRDDAVSQQVSGHAVVAAGNALAAGMMLGASALVVHEVAQEAMGPNAPLAFACGAFVSVAAVRLLAGANIGASDADNEDASTQVESGASLRKSAGPGRSVVMLMAFCTDALAEGVAMGVAAHHDELSLSETNAPTGDPSAPIRDQSGTSSLWLMTAVLIVHNVPEGMAAAAALMGSQEERDRDSVLRIALLAMATSVPQPVGAAFALACLRVAGSAVTVIQGAAAASLAWVAVMELIKDALDHISPPACAALVVSAVVGSVALHELTE
mmetsp:Transcript_18642/g.45992  ORF Transcript_18642/g.45992 Transcript_18642/m.45992 type:complete len:401 (-) Transcript_18642:240-1442(-)